MGNKKIYLFIFLVGIAVSGMGQQDPQFTQYMYTILPINPGFAGQTGICASLHYRQQWAGFRDINPATGEEFKVSPRDIMVSIHSPIKRRHGIGLTVYNDAYGYQSDIAVKLAYSFKLNIGGGNLGLGLSVDFLNRKINTAGFWNDVNGTISAGGSADPTIINNMGESDMYFDASFGAYYQVQNKWYAGISATHLISAIGGDKVEQEAARHFYALGGYEFALPSNPNWTLKPSALLKTDLTMVQLDLTLIADYNQMFWFGASYRMVDAAAVLVGARPFMNSSTPAIRGLEFIMSYDINTSKVIRYGRSYGGYEFCIKYCFKIVTPAKEDGYKGTRLLGNRPIEYR